MAKTMPTPPSSGPAPLQAGRGLHYSLRLHAESPSANGTGVGGATTPPFHKFPPPSAGGTLATAVASLPPDMRSLMCGQQGAKEALLRHSTQGLPALGRLTQEARLLSASQPSLLHRGWACPPLHRKASGGNLLPAPFLMPQGQPARGASAGALNYNTPFAAQILPLVAQVPMQTRSQMPPLPLQVQLAQTHYPVPAPTPAPIPAPGPVYSSPKQTPFSSSSSSPSPVPIPTASAWLNTPTEKKTPTGAMKLMHSFRAIFEELQ